MAAPTDSAADAVAQLERVPFGKPMRALFPFAPTYRNLNHGSFGTHPTAVGAVRAQLLAAHEARAEVRQRLATPALLDAARAALLPLLGPEVRGDEVAFVVNATTGVNVVLHNVAASWSAAAGDAVLYLSTTYGACGRTLQALEHDGRLHAVEVPVRFPRDDDDAVVQALRDAAAAAAAAGLRVRLALFDTVVSAPGLRLPWERLVAACRDDLAILSLVDGAHAVGHIDLAHLGRVRPDFFVSNCHKWLFVPRACAMLYVPRSRQHLIATCLPTSWGYLAPAHRPPPLADQDPSPTAASASYFTSLFADVGTMDYTPWMCVPAAIQWRDRVCGGEAAVRRYCIDVAQRGSDRVAAILGTEVMDNPRSCMRDCALANVRLPLRIVADADADADTDAEAVPLAQFDAAIEWVTKRAAARYDTYFRITYYEGAAWVRLSGQVYLDDDDFEWAGHTLAALCAEVRQGAWKA